MSMARERCFCTYVSHCRRHSDAASDSCKLNVMTDGYAFGNGMENTLGFLAFVASATYIRVYWCVEVRETNAKSSRPCISVCDIFVLLCLTLLNRTVTVAKCDSYVVVTYDNIVSCWRLAN